MNKFDVTPGPVPIVRLALDIESPLNVIPSVVEGSPFSSYLTKEYVYAAGRP